MPKNEKVQKALKDYEEEIRVAAAVRKAKQADAEAEFQRVKQQAHQKYQEATK